MIHTFVDRKPNRRTTRRVVELWLLWFLVAGGAFSILGGIGHIGPNSTDVAADIGYTPSMFQWEVGWGDIALGTVGVLCLWKRGSFMTAAVIVLAIGYWGDAIGHVMQWVAHDNTAVNNVWALPSDILQPLVAVVLLIVYRRLERTPATAEGPLGVAA